MPSGAGVQLVAVPETKGTGNRFEEIPLYRAMKETDAHARLPRYCFKGMSISHDAPPGFRPVCRIPDTILHQGRPVAGRQKEIHETDREGTPDA